MRSPGRSALNLYQKEAQKPILLKYSPSYKRLHLTPTILISIKNHPKKHSKSKLQQNVKNPHKMSLPSRYESPLNPEFRRSSVNNNVQSFQRSLSTKIDAKNSRIETIRAQSQQKRREVQQRKNENQRLKTEQKELVLQQIQFKRKERQRENDAKLQRKSSQRSFVLDSHKETLDMMKKSRVMSSRGQIRLVKEKNYQSEKQHQFLLIKRKSQSIKKSYEQKFNKAFLKNTPLPKNRYSSLADTLAIASKTLSSNKDKAPENKTIIQSKPLMNAKKSSSKLKLDTLKNKSSKKNVPERMQSSLEKELLERKLIEPRKSLKSLPPASFLTNVQVVEKSQKQQHQGAVTPSVTVAVSVPADLVQTAPPALQTSKMTPA